MDFIYKIIDKTFSSKYPYKLVSVVLELGAPKTLVLVEKLCYEQYDFCELFLFLKVVVDITVLTGIEIKSKF